MNKVDVELERLKDTGEILGCMPGGSGCFLAVCATTGGRTGTLESAPTLGAAPHSDVVDDDADIDDDDATTVDAMLSQLGLTNMAEDDDDDDEDAAAAAAAATSTGTGEALLRVESLRTRMGGGDVDDDDDDDDAIPNKDFVRLSASCFAERKGVDFLGLLLAASIGVEDVLFLRARCCFVFAWPICCCF